MGPRSKRKMFVLFLLLRLRVLVMTPFRCPVLMTLLVRTPVCRLFASRSARILGVPVCGVS